MTAQIVRGTEVNRPVPQPLTSSVLDHARSAGNVQEIEGAFGYVNNAGLYPSYNCLDLLTETALCPDPLISESGEVKEFDTAVWQPGFTFAVYGGVQCRAIGLDAQDQYDETRRVFERSQGKGIEQALLGTRFIASEPPGSDEPVSPYYGEWEEPEDLTPGTAIPLAVALALLEGDAADKYAGLPTIHMPRAAATVLETHGLIVWRGDLAYTKNGSRVAIGGGYDNPEMLATGLWDMYATGEVSIQMRKVIDVRSYEVLPGMADSGSDGNGLLENGIVTLAERMYRVGVDCYVAKITGKAF
jgi:hypothetical protein